MKRYISTLNSPKQFSIFKLVVVAPEPSQLVVVDQINPSFWRNDR
jgi:hypothetical protein